MEKVDAAINSSKCGFINIVLIKWMTFLLSQPHGNILRTQLIYGTADAWNLTCCNSQYWLLDVLSICFLSAAKGACLDGLCVPIYISIQMYEFIWGGVENFSRRRGMIRNRGWEWVVQTCIIIWCCHPLGQFLQITNLCAQCRESLKGETRFSELIHHIFIHSTSSWRLLLAFWRFRINHILLWWQEILLLCDGDIQKNSGFSIQELASFFLHQKWKNGVLGFCFSISIFVYFFESTGFIFILMK